MIRHIVQINCFLSYKKKKFKAISKCDNFSANYFSFSTLYHNILWRENSSHRSGMLRATQVVCVDRSPELSAAVPAVSLITDTAQTQHQPQACHQAACDWSLWHSSVMCHYCERSWKWDSFGWTVIPTEILLWTTLDQLKLENDAKKSGQLCLCGVDAKVFCLFTFNVAFFLLEY